MRQPKAVISVAILLVIGLHAVPVLHNQRRQTLWPVLKWSMYKNPRPPGPITADLRRIMGLTSRGETYRVTPKLVGLSSFALSRKYLEPMRAGDSSAAQQLISRLNLEREDSTVELRLEVETYTITDTGIVKEGKPVITYRADPSAPR